MFCYIYVLNQVKEIKIIVNLLLNIYARFFSSWRILCVSCEKTGISVVMF